MHIPVFLDRTMHFNFILLSCFTISFAYHFEIQWIKSGHILLNNWQILISETSVKSLNYLDSVGIKKETGVSQNYFIPRESL